jgi:hypothetical protein
LFVIEAVDQLDLGLRQPGRRANKTGVSERNSSSVGSRALRAADSGGRGAHLVKLLGARSETRVFRFGHPAARLGAMSFTKLYTLPWG